MRSLLALTVASFGLLAALASPFAAERTVALAVDNMTCGSCSYIVNAALQRVEGVGEVQVSLREGTALVTFDDTRADIAALTRATAAYGFPSRPLEQQGTEPR